MTKLLVLFTFVAMTPGSSWAKMYGKFMVVKGVVQVEKPGKSAVKAKIGFKVEPKDKIITGANSRAKIVMSDRNVIHVSPNTSFLIKTYTNSGSEKNVELKLEKGKIRNNVENRYDGDKNKFLIKTPTAVAGVRGTQFITSYKSATKTTEVVTLKGRVSFSSVGPKGQVLSSVMVNKGFRSATSQGGKVEAPKSIPKTQLKEIDRESAGKRAADPKSTGGSSANSGGTASGSGSSPAAPSAGGVDLPKTDTVAPPSRAMTPVIPRPNPARRNLPESVIRNKNNKKSRVIIRPQPPGGAANNGGTGSPASGN